MNILKVGHKVVNDMENILSYGVMEIQTQPEEGKFSFDFNEVLKRAATVLTPVISGKEIADEVVNHSTNFSIHSVIIAQQDNLIFRIQPGHVGAPKSWQRGVRTTTWTAVDGVLTGPVAHFNPTILIFMELYENESRISVEASQAAVELFDKLADAIAGNQPAAN